MNILRNLFFSNQKKTKNKEIFNQEIIDHYREIGKLVNEARIAQDLTIEELSCISKIPAQTISSIENNIEDLRPKYPFIRSILIKLENCLILEKNILVNLITKETNTIKKDKKDFVISKFDLINTWQGSLLYFLMLLLTIFILERHFISNPNIIEIRGIDNTIKK